MHYRLTDQDVNDIFLAVGSRAQVRAGDVRPAMVITVGESLGVQVFIGPCTLWRESVKLGTTQCFWPPRV